MTAENPNKIDMTKERDSDQWQALLDCVKVNPINTKTGKPYLSKQEQDYYVKEIECKINGAYYSNAEVLADIASSSADIDDIGN